MLSNARPALASMAVSAAVPMAIAVFHGCGSATSAPTAVVATIDEAQTLKEFTALSHSDQVAALDLIGSMTLQNYYEFMLDTTTDAPIRVNGAVQLGTRTSWVAVKDQFLKMRDVYPTMQAMWTAQKLDPLRIAATAAQTASATKPSAALDLAWVVKPKFDNDQCRQYHNSIGLQAVMSGAFLRSRFANGPAPTQTLYTYAARPTVSVGLHFGSSTPGGTPPPNFQPTTGMAYVQNENCWDVSWSDDATPSRSDYLATQGQYDANGNLIGTGTPTAGSAGAGSGTCSASSGPTGGNSGSSGGNGGFWGLGSCLYGGSGVKP